MRTAIVVSCNAYFAQLGTYKVGPEALLDTATRLGISVANPSNVKTLRAEMPQTSYGQGQVVASSLSNGARGSHHCPWWLHALRPLGDRPDEPSAGPAASDSQIRSCPHRWASTCAVSSPPALAAAQICPTSPWPARQEQRSSSMLRRTPGSSDLPRMADRTNWHFPF